MYVLYNDSPCASYHEQPGPPSQSGCVTLTPCALVTSILSLNRWWGNDYPENIDIVYWYVCHQTCGMVSKYRSPGSAWKSKRENDWSVCCPNVSRCRTKIWIWAIHHVHSQIWSAQVRGRGNPTFGSPTRRHQKSQTRVLVGPRKELASSKNSLVSLRFKQKRRRHFFQMGS